MPKRSELISIAPDQARSLLEHYNGHNRRFRPIIVELVKDALLGDRWRVNGETIILGYTPATDKGIVLDGQNRLKGCILAGKPLSSWVIFGQDPEDFATIDRGAMRSIADDLSIIGHKNVALLAAAAKLADAYMKGDRSQNIMVGRALSENVTAFVAANPGIVDSVDTAGPKRKTIPVAGRVMCALHYLFGLKNAGIRDEYFARLEDGAAMEVGHPILAIRQRIFQDQAKSAKSLRNQYDSAFSCMYLMIRAWNCMRSGKNAPSYFKVTTSVNGRGLESIVLPDIE
jgi:hypothetical protein